jgi:glutaredoxin/ABC-type polysaccharide/polyol phosphate export permease
MSKSSILKYAIIFSLIISILPFSFAAEACPEHDIHFFYSRTCPHCKSEMKFLKQIEGEYPELKINYLEIPINSDMLEEFAQEYNTSTTGVPRTFIGDKAFVGFAWQDGPEEFNPALKAYTGYGNQLRKEILDLLEIKNDQIKQEEQKQAFNALWILILPLLYLLSYLIFRKKLRQKGFHRHWLAGLIALIIISLFIIVTLTPETVIKNFASSLPFPIFVFIIALADGFNPCAFTVLVILLSLLTYTKDKKSMAIIGMTFIITSAIIYFIFIMVMIGVGEWAIQKYGPVIMTSLGIILLFAGIINVKDFFFFKKGLSLSISDKHKSRITRHAVKISKLLQESKSLRTFLFALAATVLLAVFVNLVELGCTALLPAAYMISLLKTVGYNTWLQVFWTMIYSVIYIIPLLAILSDFIYTFKSTRMTEKQGRILKLISGIFMLAFGIIMVFKPELLVFA